MNNRSSSMGGVPMVKIDGSKIRELREEKGLTQLYLATAVEVTTDTISRWENRRYPAIKRENALKLAEALEVDLDVILEKDNSDDSVKPVIEDEQKDTEQGKHQYLKSRLAFLSIAVILLAGGFGFYWFGPAVGDANVTAKRVMPSHTAPGQPFPVVIFLSSSAEKPTTVIVREEIPVNSAIIQNESSKTPVSDKSNGEVKWIRKFKGQDAFGFTVVSNASQKGDTLDFYGKVTVRKFSGSGKKTQGEERVVVDEFHWADVNKDNRIDDQEILAVYEDFTEIRGLTVDMDFIEDIWFGSGYKWDNVQNNFIILP